MKMKEQKASLQIKGIEVQELNLRQPEQPLDNQTIFHFDIGIEHRVNLDNKIIVVVPTVNVRHDSSERTLATLTTSFIFEVENMTDFYDKEQQQITLPETLLTTLNSVSLSTLRGLLFSTFKGTFLHNAILPLVDPASFAVNKEK
jgi:hypothetical protein